MRNKINIEEIKLLIPDYITGSLSEEESGLRGACRIIPEPTINSEQGNFKT